MGYFDDNHYKLADGSTLPLRYSEDGLDVESLGDENGTHHLRVMDTRTNTYHRIEGAEYANLKEAQAALAEHHRIKTAAIFEPEQESVIGMPDESYFKAKAESRKREAETKYDNIGSAFADYE